MHFANESNLSFIKQQQLRSHGNFRDTRKTIASNCEEFRVASRVGLWWLKSSPDLIRIQSRLTRKHIEIHVTSCYGSNDPMLRAVNFPLVCKYLAALPTTSWRTTVLSIFNALSWDRYVRLLAGQISHYVSCHSPDEIGAKVMFMLRRQRVVVRSSSSS